MTTVQWGGTNVTFGAVNLTPYRRGGKLMLLSGRNEQLSGTSAGPNGTVQIDHVTGLTTRSEPQ